MMSALAIEHRELVYTVDPEVWGAMPHDYASIAAWHLGLKEEALRHGRIALDKEPGNERFVANVSMMVQHLGQEAASLLEEGKFLEE
jgi:hypothetical protein